MIDLTWSGPIYSFVNYFVFLNKFRQLINFIVLKFCLLALLLSLDIFILFSSRLKVCSGNDVSECNGGGKWLRG